MLLAGRVRRLYCQVRRTHTQNIDSTDQRKPNMGQYHMIANLDKREFIYPHKLGCGLKQQEILYTNPGPAQALFVLLCASNARGGGDLPTCSLPPEGEVLGRWAGDRIAVVGDYGSDDDLPNYPNAGGLYELCQSVEDWEEESKYAEEGDTITPKDELFTDISDLLIPYFDNVLKYPFPNSFLRREKEKSQE